jgi:hypothetical protein
MTNATSNHYPPLTPFFVADRPASLRILRGVPLGDYEGKLGIMAHANTSENFQRILRQFPCAPELHPDGCDEHCKRLQKRVTKICDSGVFTKQGCPMEYDALFEVYARMGVDFGIIVDTLRDRKATLKSAQEAMRVYRQQPRSFKLIGVAQGNSPREYLECYRALKAIGFEHIAVGGLLKKRENTSHYVYVQSADRLARILGAIRAEYPTDWLFALGCYHPTRHLMFQRLGLFGADYKGWIFNYKARNGLGATKAQRSRFSQVRQFISSQIYDSGFYLNGAAAEVEQARGKGETLVVVSCGARKVWDDKPGHGPVAARNAYTGLFFRRNREYAELFGDGWAILSAKHGLVKPNSRIPRNYNNRFHRGSQTVTTRHLRQQILERGFHRYSRVVVLGGKEYGEALAEAYAGMGIPVERPLEKYTAIGFMTQAVIRAVSTERELTARRRPQRGR